MSGGLPIQIVGGGLSGLALGIALRRNHLPVTVLDAGSYPRHRVCGEFICGKGGEILLELGLEEQLRDMGAFHARQAVFYSAEGREWDIALRALCVSRYKLDALLAATFREAGGSLSEKTFYKGPLNEEGTVCAAGRRRQHSGGAWHWFGLKVHARRVRLESDLEMHFVPDGYVGLCSIDAEWTNVCGCFRKRPGEDPTSYSGSKLKRLMGADGSCLDKRLRDAEFAPESVCAAAGFPLTRAQSPVNPAGQCSVGDALGMIPPLTGNGMSMALESASLAIKPLLAYGKGEAGWAEVCDEVSAACARRFDARLRWAYWMHVVLMEPKLRQSVFALARRFPLMGRMVFQRTR